MHMYHGALLYLTNFFFSLSLFFSVLAHKPRGGKRGNRSYHPHVWVACRDLMSPFFIFSLIFYGYYLSLPQLEPVVLGQLQERGHIYLARAHSFFSLVYSISPSC